MPPDPSSSEALAGFRALSFDLAQCHHDLKDLEALLASAPELGEKEHILPFFKARPHLSLFLGSYGTYLDRYDRLAYEFDLFGGFKPDIVVGDWAAKSYCFVEFEDARKNSIFQETNRHTKIWAPRFERGFSQIIDWFCLLEGNQDTPQFESKFGKRRINASALLVTGRDSGVPQSDRHRLEWRRDHVVVNSQKIWCCTFDELLDGLRRKLTLRPLILLDALDGELTDSEL